MVAGGFGDFGGEDEDICGGLNRHKLILHVFCELLAIAVCGGLKRHKPMSHAFVRIAIRIGPRELQNHTRLTIKFFPTPF